MLPARFGVNDPPPGTLGPQEIARSSAAGVRERTAKESEAKELLRPKTGGKGDEVLYGKSEGKELLRPKTGGKE